MAIPSTNSEACSVVFYGQQDPNIEEQCYWKDDAINKWLRKDNIDELLIANAFIRNTGISHFTKTIKKAIKSGTKVKIIYGEDFGLTEAKAIKKLLNIGCNVKVCKAEWATGFHPKLLVIIYKNGDSIICGGSSNLTLGGLERNVEFNISINGDKNNFTDTIKFFNNLWDNSSDIDEEYLNQYEELEKIQKRYDPFEVIITVPDQRMLKEYIDSWIKKIKYDKKRNGCMEWRGWYLFPEHGNINQDKMIELQKICEALYMLSDDNAEIKIDNTTAGLDKVGDILDHASISYHHEYDMKTKRNWLVRQQINYLEKMKFISRTGRGIYRINPLCEEFINIAKRNLKKYYTQRIEDIGWAWGNIKYVSFIKKLLLLFPDKSISEKEFNYFISHSHYNEEVLYMFELISKFRNLRNKTKFIKNQDRLIKNEILLYRTPHAYAHYLSKTRSLMKDLSYCMNFELKEINGELYLTLVGTPSLRSRTSRRH